MPTFAEMLRQRAIEFANDIKQRSHAAKKRLAELEEEKLGLEAQLLAADESYARLKSFTPLIDGVPQCPACFARRGRHVAMNPVSSTSDYLDVFSCPDCDNREVTEP